MLTEKEKQHQLNLIKKRDELNKEIGLLEFRKDNVVLGDLQTLLDKNSDSLDKKLNIAIVTQKEYDYIKSEDNIYDMEMHNFRTLKSHLGDGFYVVLSRILDIVLETDANKGEVCLWIIIRD